MMARIVIAIKQATHLGECVAASLFALNSGQMVLKVGCKFGIVILPVRASQLLHVYTPRLYPTSGGRGLQCIGFPNLWCDNAGIRIVRLNEFA